MNVPFPSELPDDIPMPEEPLEVPEPVNVKKDRRLPPIWKWRTG